MKVNLGKSEFESFFLAKMLYISRAFVVLKYKIWISILSIYVKYNIKWRNLRFIMGLV